MQVVFTEACTHGALPWKADHQRRALLYRFSPGHAAYTPGVAKLEYPRWVQEITVNEEAAVLLNPGMPANMRHEHVVEPALQEFLEHRSRTESAADSDHFANQSHSAHNKLASKL